MDLLTQISLAIFSILPGNYSGISHVEDNLYIVVDDKDKVDGFKLLTLDIDSVSGKITNASMSEPRNMAQRRAAGTGTYRDCEGVAFCNAMGTVFVSGEEDQQILEYTLDGQPTGRALDVPSLLNIKNIAPNLGFEALTYNDKQKLFWTTTESTLMSDGKRTSVTDRNVNNLLRLTSFGIDMKMKGMIPYMMDKPQAKKNTSILVHGVPALLALDDGRLIVMEREANITKKHIGSTCTIKLYLVETNTQSTTLNTLDTLPSEAFVHKELLLSFTTKLKVGKLNFANYEGMCLGPKLADGRQTIILISDSQNGMGNSLYHLKDYVRVIILDNI